MSQGFAIETIVGARILGQGTFVPAHIKNGKEINAKCTFPVRVNKKYRKDDYNITGWGKLADTMARSCSPGKVMNISGDPQNYLGTMFDRNGTVRTDAAGQPIMVRKSSITIDKVEFCGESAKFIGEEIAHGKRPVDWNIPGTAGELQYKNMLATNKLKVWDGQSPEFGFCRVFVPQGVQLQAIQQPVATGAGVINPANMPGAVRNALSAAPTTVVPEKKYQLADGTPCTKDGVPLTQPVKTVVTAAGGAGGAGALVY